MGSKSERLVNPFLERFDNPKGNSAYKLFSIMSKEKKFVAKNNSVLVTPAQEKLLQLITPLEAAELFSALKTIHYLGTYCVDNDVADLQASYQVHTLMDALQELNTENLINNLRPA